MPWEVVVIIIALVLVIGAVSVQKLLRNSNDEFRNTLLLRYCQTIEEGQVDRSEKADRLIAYLERMVDRELNKARGILPFNSLIMAMMSLEINRIKFNLNDPESMHATLLYQTYIVIGMLSVSSLLCLTLFLIHWGSVDQYSFSREVRSTIKVLKDRAIVLEIAVWMSIAALVIGAFVFGWGEGHSAPVSLSEKQENKSSCHPAQSRTPCPN